MRTIYHRLYDKLQPIVKALGDEEYVKLESKGFMDLHVNRLYSEEEGAIRLSLAHRFIQNGDSMADPDMEVHVYPDRDMAEALTFQQDGYLAIYNRVYHISEDGAKMVNTRMKKELNTFLNFWLKNIKDQGFFN